MDSLIGIIVIVSIVAVVLDYGVSGWFLVKRSKDKELAKLHGKLFQTLTGGIGYLLLTVVGHVSFWLFNVLLNEVFDVPQILVLVLVIVYAVFCGLSIFGRRRWMKKIIQ